MQVKPRQRAAFGNAASVLVGRFVYTRAVPDDDQPGSLKAEVIPEAVKRHRRSGSATDERYRSDINKRKLHARLSQDCASA